MSGQSGETASPPTEAGGFDWEATYRRLATWQASLEGDTLISAEETTRILRDRARVLAKPKQMAASEESIDLLVFALGDGRFGMRIGQIEAVIPLQGTTPVPCTPRSIFGVTNYSSEILAVLDLRPYVGIPVADQAPTGGVVVVVQALDRRFGMLATAVVGIDRIAASKLTPMPVFQSSGQENGMEGITLEMVILLEAEHLAHDPNQTVNDGLD